jgi:hypothetical protein
MIPTDEVLGTFLHEGRHSNIVRGLRVLGDHDIPRLKAERGYLIRSSGSRHEFLIRANHLAIVNVSVVAEAYRDVAVDGLLVDVANAN